MNFSRQFSAATFLGLVFLAGLPAMAHAQTASQTAAPESVSDGVVQKIDPKAQRVTIKHGEIRNLGMPPMTMVFKVRESNMLDNVKVGDPVKFVVIMEGQDMVISFLRVAK